MKRLTNRRSMLLAAGTAAVAVAAGAAAAQSRDVGGTVTYEGGAPIPKGQIAISLEDSAVASTARTGGAVADIQSDGGTKIFTYSITLPDGTAVSPTQEIVVQLLREDGWLLARGSAQVQPDTPVYITLYTVMY
jgi:hypothetical protein